MSETKATAKKRGGWNYRVMRHVEKVGANDETFYAIHEVYYNADDTISGWTADVCGSPCGETLEEMLRDMAWILAGISKPVLDHATGKEIEPAAMLADDLGKMLRDQAKKPPALSRASSGE